MKPLMQIHVYIIFHDPYVCLSGKHSPYTDVDRRGSTMAQDQDLRSRGLDGILTANLHVGL
jgi:hypothetical protein